MCLFTHLGEACTADKDITCYKVVYPGDRWKLPANVFKSAVMDFQYKVGETYDEPEYRSISALDVNTCSRLVFKGFHSYRKLSEATLWAMKWTIILKCVIPAGSRYFYDPNKTQYCSDKLRVVAWRQPFTRPRRWSTEQRTDEDAIKAFNMYN